MFKISKSAELTTDILNKMIEAFNLNVVPQLRKYKKYYDGKQAIMDKKYQDATKPCSHPITNFCQDITDSYTGYIATPGYITYSSNDDISDIMDVLKYNDYQTEDNEFLETALKYGVAVELMYLDEESQTRFKLIDPLSCFGVYDDSLTNDLLYFVRMYKVNEWDDAEDYYVDVYSDNDIRHYLMSGSSGSLKFLTQETHYFGQCPANIFYLSDEKSVFDCVMDLQDSYNELLGSEIDDFSAFCDAYLYLIGCDADEDDIASMKENRILLLPEGAQTGYLTKNTNDTQVENMLKRINDNIYRIAHCPDFSSETFVGGVSSGIAIRYRLTGMETRAGKIEAQMKKALMRRLEIICGIATLKIGEDIFQNINIDFKRNIPEDIQSVVSTIGAFKGTVSDKTLLSQIPFIDDIDAELEAVEEQKKHNMAVYDFSKINEEESENLDE